MIFKCYSSEKLITLNTLHEVVPTWYSFQAESTEAMRIKSLAQGENILMLGFEPSTSVSFLFLMSIQDENIYSLLHLVSFLFECTNIKLSCNTSNVVRISYYQPYHDCTGFLILCINAKINHCQIQMWILPSSLHV